MRSIINRLTARRLFSLALLLAAAAGAGSAPCAARSAQRGVVMSDGGTPSHSSSAPTGYGVTMLNGVTMGDRTAAGGDATPAEGTVMGDLRAPAGRRRRALAAVGPTRRTLQPSR